MVIKSIFFGGGTPSVLTPSEFTKICNTLHNSFSIDKDVEWTIEVNPESFTEKKAESWLNNGVNRLSIGVQSLNDNELNAVGRVHKRERALEVLSNEILKKFNSISVDIIYGLPLQNLSSLKDTLSTLLSFSIIKHISAYELTLAEGTPLFNNRDAIPSDDKTGDLAEFTHKYLLDKKFMRYEVSNFSKEEFECIHNIRYWKRSAYIGFGPSAHSFSGTYRWSNPADLIDYNKSIGVNRAPILNLEEISATDAVEETLFLNLRMADGIDKIDFEKKFSFSFDSFFSKDVIEELVRLSMVENSLTRFNATAYGLDFVDAIVSKLVG